jgi:hypothetical protein
MMRRIWAGIAATCAVIAIFVVLAASQRPVLTGGGTAVVMARTATGALVPVKPGSAAVHATTSSSTVASSSSTSGGQAVTYVKAANGAFVPVSSAAPAAAVTRTS